MEFQSLCSPCSTLSFTVKMQVRVEAGQVMVVVVVAGKEAPGKAILRPFERSTMSCFGDSGFSVSGW